ncbi:ubiquitinyl hydrolase 1, partial [Opisthorchis viverrini]
LTNLCRWSRNPVFLACAGSVVGVFVIFGYSRMRVLFRTLTAAENDLPMGLPNPRNLCYLNALLQAMSTNASLVRFLKRSAHTRRSKLLYCLVCLLKALRCSNDYILAHNLENVLREVHTAFMYELANARSWSTDEQQDAHELFGFLMDVACCRELGRTAFKASEGLTSVSRFIGPRYEQVVPRSFHRARVNSVHNPFILHAPMRIEVFQQHLLVSQVTCRRCDYRSSPVLQPEACLTVFFEIPDAVFTNPARVTTVFHSIFPSYPFHLVDCSSYTAAISRHQRYTHLGIAKQQSTSPIPPRLSDCLAKQFGTSEPLQDLHCPKCQPTAKNLSGHTGLCQQERWIAHLPSCLVLHVQRSAWLGRTGISWNPFGELLACFWLCFCPTSVLETMVSARFGSKRQDYVSFPCRLNMARYMLSSRSNATSDSDHQDSGGVYQQSAISQIHARQPRTYVLRAVLVHQGESINSGHYITYRVWRKRDPKRSVREPVYLRFLRYITTSVSNFFHGIPNRTVRSSSPWIFTSDAHVLRVSSDEVRSSLAYLLFYERDTHASTYEPGSRSMSASFTDLDNKGSDWDLGDSAYAPPITPEETDDELDPGDMEEESDETSDAGENFTGCSKAEIIRTYALAASQL